MLDNSLFDTLARCLQYKSQEQITEEVMKDQVEKKRLELLDKEIKHQCSFLVRPDRIGNISLGTIAIGIKRDHITGEDNGTFKTDGEMFVWIQSADIKKKARRIFNKYAKPHGLKVNREGNRLVRR